MPAARILVVDDEEGIRAFLREALADVGHQVEEAADGAAALARLERASFHLLITDLRMPGVDGMQLLREAKAATPEMEVIVLTAHGSVEAAVQAMRLGAYDFLTKPISGPDELRLTVERALERRRLRSAAAPAEVDLVALDPAMQPALAAIRKVAPTAASVLLLGESGTGKELAARAIHALSPRAAGPFVAVNCAAVSAELVESEMFGHEKGAFTGATQRRAGRFELADGGTLLLDEVGELPLALQAKLLRVLAERSFERVGGSRTIAVDVRVLAATNRDLAAEIAAGRFRADLYHRLAVFPIELPPLRDRPADLEPLCRHLLARIARALNRPGLTLAPEALARLAQHAWPGNVRELGNALERAAILASGERIEAAHIVLAPLARPAAVAAGAAGAALPALGGTLADLEREAIRQALERSGGHRKKAAESLGIGLRTLYDKLRLYQIDSAGGDG